MVKIVHLHGFKCAGTTFIWILEKIYGSKLLYVEKRGGKERLFWKDLQEACNLLNYNAITSHTLEFPRIQANDYLFVEFVREPLSRIKSAYNFQIKVGDMATVVGIFEDQYKRNKSLTVVKPGTQSRRFTHIHDTVKICFLAWKKNKCKFYSISNKKSFTILDVAKMFKSKIKYLPRRPGERYASALTKMNLTNKIYKYYGKILLKDYIGNFVNKKKHLLK